MSNPASADVPFEKGKTLKEYTYCPDCHNKDDKGYRGKRCKWCSALLIKDPFKKFIRIEGDLK